METADTTFCWKKHFYITVMRHQAECCRKNVKIGTLQYFFKINWKSVSVFNGTGRLYNSLWRGWLLLLTPTRLFSIGKGSKTASCLVSPYWYLQKQDRKDFFFCIVGERVSFPQTGFSVPSVWLFVDRPTKILVSYFELLLLNLSDFELKNLHFQACT